MASASAYWPALPYTTTGVHHPYMTPYMGSYMPYSITKLSMKPEEYTKTMEYKTGFPYWNPTMVKMPEVEKDYAMKGQYKAEAAGGVVHMAKRDAEADPWMLYNNFGYSAMPMTYRMPYMPYTSYMPIAPAFPKLVADDRMKADTPEYADKGKYVADNGKIVHLAKREATSPIFVEKKDEDKKLILPSTIYPSVYGRIFPTSTVYPYTTTPFINTPYTTFGRNIINPYGLWY